MNTVNNITLAVAAGFLLVAFLLGYVSGYHRGKPRLRRDKRGRFAKASEDSNHSLSIQ